jgi:hypothetical protein
MDEAKLLLGPNPDPPKLGEINRRNDLSSLATGMGSADVVLGFPFPK